jgi:hypothetical protein
MVALHAVTCVLAVYVLLPGVAVASPVPRLINYQGFLADDVGQPLQGSHDILFRIYPDSLTSGFIWEEMHTAVALNDGVFTVYLGSNHPLDYSYFEDQPRFLGITVDAGGEIAPRGRITSVPWAYRAAVADSLAAAQPVPSHDHDDLYYREVELDSTGTINQPDNPVDWTKLKGVPEGFADGVDDEGSGAGDGHSLDASDGSPTDAVYVDAEGLVGIGTTTPDVTLHVATGTDVNPTGGAFLQMGSSSATNLAIDNNEIMTRIAGAASDMYVNREGGHVMIGNLGYDSRLGIGVSSPWATLTVSNDLASPGNPTNGLIYADNENDSSPLADASVGVRVNGPSAGNPYVSYDIRGEAGWSTGIDNDDENKFKIAARWDDIAVNTRVTVTTGGNVGIGTTNPAERLDVRGNIIIRSESSGDVVIELGEGLDYAEGFDVTEHDDVAPGAVLVIDSDSPGRLEISTEAYDSRVAGIVAGANGIGSGVRLGSGRFPHDVALAGRVYCNVDATECGIEPGDLLTTSSIPGHAMKASDPARRAGAILGKAMERLERGTRGRILVLVSLQ